MDINTEHPSFITFLDNIIKLILTEIDISDYFKQSIEKKLKMQKTLFNLLKKNIKVRAFITDNDIKAFLFILQKKNDEIENYEISAILKDIVVNYDTITQSENKKNIVVNKVSQ